MQMRPIDLTINVTRIYNEKKNVPFEPQDVMNPSKITSSNYFVEGSVVYIQFLSLVPLKSMSFVNTLKQHLITKEVCQNIRMIGILFLSAAAYLL